MAGEVQMGTWKKRWTTVTTSPTDPPPLSRSRRKQVTSACEPVFLFWWVWCNIELPTLLCTVSPSHHARSFQMQGRSEQTVTWRREAIPNTY